MFALRRATHRRPGREAAALFTIRDPSAAPPSRRCCKRQKTQPELGQIVQPCKHMHCTRSRSSHQVRRQSRHLAVGTNPDTERATEKTPTGGTSQCRTKTSRRHGSAPRANLPKSPGRRAAVNREINPVPYDLLRMPIEGAAREAQGQTHLVRAAIGSGEDIYAAQDARLLSAAGNHHFSQFPRAGCGM